MANIQRVNRYVIAVVILLFGTFATAAGTCKQYSATFAGVSTGWLFSAGGVCTALNGFTFAGGKGRLVNITLSGTAACIGEQWDVNRSGGLPDSKAGNVNITIQSRNGVCGCAAGYVETAGGACVSKAALECAERAKPGYGRSGTLGFKTPTSAVPSSACDSRPVMMDDGPRALDCAVAFEADISFKGQDGQWSHEGSGLYTGAVCSTPKPDPEQPEAKEPKCPGGQPGLVNGVEVCLPFNPQTDTASGQSDDSKTVNDGTNTTTTTNNSNTTCAGGNCTTITNTTTTITNNGTGASTSTTATTTTTKPAADHCKDKPQAKECTGKAPGEGNGDGDGKSTWGGSCTQGFACKGDAIQCAIAKETHEQWCRLNKPGPESTLFNQMASKSGTNQTGDITGSKEVSLGPDSFDTTDAFGGGGQCITDKTINVLGTSVVLPFSKVCDPLSHFRLLLIGVSFLIGARIVIRG